MGTSATVASVLFVVLYIVANKWIKGHDSSRYISSGLKRSTDRILFGTVILICSLFARESIPTLPGTLLLLSCMGISLWDYTKVMHYVSAFGIAFVVAYLMVRMASDTLDYSIILCTISVIWVLVIYMILWVPSVFPINHEFASECEHLAFLFAAVYFLRKFSIGP